MSLNIRSELVSNPYLTAIRTLYQQLSKFSAENDAIVCVPCTASLLNSDVSQEHIEHHILIQKDMLDHVSTLSGKTLIFNEKQNQVTTRTGFPEDRTCSILHRERVYESGGAFQVYILDKPFIGAFNALPSDFNIGSIPRASIEDCLRWLDSFPNIKNKLMADLESFERTFSYSSGCQRDWFNRLLEISKATWLSMLDKVDGDDMKLPGRVVVDSQSAVEEAIITAAFPPCLKFFDSVLSESYTLFDNFKTRLLRESRDENILRRDANGRKTSIAFCDIQNVNYRESILEKLKIPRPKIEGLASLSLLDLEPVSKHFSILCQSTSPFDFCRAVSQFPVLVSDAVNRGLTRSAASSGGNFSNNAVVELSADIVNPILVLALVEAPLTLSEGSNLLTTQIFLSKTWLEAQENSEISMGSAGYWHTAVVLALGTIWGEVSANL